MTVENLTTLLSNFQGNSLIEVDCNYLIIWPPEYVVTGYSNYYDAIRIPYAIDRRKEKKNV